MQITRVERKIPSPSSAPPVFFFPLSPVAKELVAPASLSLSLSLSLCHSVSGHASCTAVDGADHLPAVPCHAGLPDRGPVSALPYVYRRHTGAAVQRDVRLLPLHFNSAPEYEPRDVPAVPDGHVHPRQHPRGSCGASGTSKAMRLHRPTTHRRCIRR